MKNGSNYTYLHICIPTHVYTIVNNIFCFVDYIAFSHLGKLYICIHVGIVNPFDKIDLLST